MNSYNHGTYGAQDIVEFMALHNLTVAWNRAFGKEQAEEAPHTGRLKALAVLLVCAIPIALLVVPAITFTF